MAASFRSAARALMRSSGPDPTSFQPAFHIRSRGFAAAAAGHHDEPPKVDFWKSPLSPSKWKEEHFVLVSLAGWGLLIYGGKRAFSGAGNKPEADSAKH